MSQRGSVIYEILNIYEFLEICSKTAQEAKTPKYAKYNSVHRLIRCHGTHFDID